MAAAKKAGKPTAVDPVLTTAQKCEAVGIEAICERIADCKTLQVIAEEIGISKGSLIVWLASKPDQYARAREAQAEKHAEDMLAIADEVHVEAKYDGDDVKLVLDATAVARNRLRVDTRKWLAAKMAPKKYGERLNLDADVTVNELSPDERAKRIALLAAKLQKNAV